MPPARDVADGECVRLWRTTDERKRYDDFATLYALARALEKLERAYVRSSVDAKAYERACVDLTSKFKTLRSVLRAKSLKPRTSHWQTFIANYRCLATRWIKMNSCQWSWSWNWPVQ